MLKSLAQTVTGLARMLEPYSDADLEQPWAWGPHEEGVRFALIGTSHELRDLALHLASARERQNRSLTQAQRALAFYHAAYRDLLALLLGVDDATYSQEPAPGEWPLRYVFGHLVAAERRFYTLVHFGLRRQREGGDLPPRLPPGETERVLGPVDDLLDIMENHGLEEMLAYYEVQHRLTLDDFAGMTDDELEGPSRWWEEIDYALRHRLLRFEAHLRQHTAQVEKTLDALQRPRTEARLLIRQLYGALATVEGLALGAPDLDQEAATALAEQIRERATEVAAVVAEARRLEQAVHAGDSAIARQLLAARPALADAVDQGQLPLVLTALYEGQPALAALLAEAGAQLSIFEGAALGRMDVVEREAGEEPGAIDAYARDGFTPLQLACYFGNENVARWLLDQGAAVNAVSRNDQRLMAIHAAAANGSTSLCAALLQAGADVNARQAGGFTALHAAAQSGRRELALLLLAHGADAHLRTDQGRLAADFGLGFP